MKHSKKLTRSLLLAVFLLGVLWTALPPSGEAASTQTGHGITWELTGAAIQRTLNGDCDHMGVLDTCREECIFGSPTGNFGCYSS